MPSLEHALLSNTTPTQSVSTKIMNWKTSMQPWMLSKEEAIQQDVFPPLTDKQEKASPYWIIDVMSQYVHQMVDMSLSWLVQRFWPAVSLDRFWLLLQACKEHWLALETLIMFVCRKRHAHIIVTKMVLASMDFVFVQANVNLLHRVWMWLWTLTKWELQVVFQSVPVELRFTV